MTTSQTNILEKAKNGQPDAIAALLNRNLQPKGITAKASVKNNCFWIASYDRALEIKLDKHEAWYGKACAYSLQNQIELALENLQKAIQINPEENREIAKTDSDFDNIRHDPRFQALIR